MPSSRSSAGPARATRSSPATSEWRSTPPTASTPAPTTRSPTTASALGLLLRRERARVPRAPVDPRRELAVGPHVVGVDAEPPLHLPAAHLHRAGVGGRDERVRLFRVDADEETALPARGDGHVAADHEGEPAEHLLLGQTGLAAEQALDPIRELLVVRHGAIVRQRWRADRRHGDLVAVTFADEFSPLVASALPRRFRPGGSTHDQGS